MSVKFKVPVTSDNQRSQPTDRDTFNFVLIICFTCLLWRAGVCDLKMTPIIARVSVPDLGIPFKLVDSILSPLLPLFVPDFSAHGCE